MIFRIIINNIYTYFVRDADSHEARLTGIERHERIRKRIKIKTIQITDELLLIND